MKIGNWEVVTVGELIVELGKFDPALSVFTPGTGSCADSLVPICHGAESNILSGHRTGTAQQVELEPNRFICERYKKNPLDVYEYDEITAATPQDEWRARYAVKAVVIE